MTVTSPSLPRSAAAVDSGDAHGALHRCAIGAVALAARVAIEMRRGGSDRHALTIAIQKFPVTSTDRHAW